MGFFSKMMDRCPKCTGQMDIAPDISLRIQQKAADRGDFQAMAASMQIGGATYFRCKKCGYAEERKIVGGYVTKKPYVE